MLFSHLMNLMNKNGCLLAKHNVMFCRNFLAVLWFAVAFNAAAAFSMPSDTLELPFFDDFSYNNSCPDTALWVNKGVTISNTLPYNPPSIGAAVFDALDSLGNFYSSANYGVVSQGDTLCSKSINLDYEGDNSIWLTFFYQPAGLGDAPEQNDSLVLDFYSPITEQWITMKSYAGSKRTEFIQEKINITDRIFLQNGFRFRFRNYFSLGSSLSPDIVGNCDFWLIDYVKLDRNRSDADTVYADVAIKTPISFKYGNYFSVPWLHYSANPQKLNLNYYFEFRNNDIYSRHLDSINLYLSNSEIKQFSLGSFNLPESYDVVNENFNFDFVLEGNAVSSFYNAQLKLVTNQTDEDFAGNNVYDFSIDFSDCYAYDDGTAEAGYGIYGEGTASACVAVKFVTLMPDNINGVYMWFNKTFNDAQASYFNIRVWDCKNGLPGNVIYAQDDVETPKENTENFAHFPFNQLIAVSDTFFVGWQKSQSAILNVGFDKNTMSINPKYVNIDGTWKTSSENGQIMIRPIFGELSTAIEDFVSENNNFDNENVVTLYPNPAKNYFNIKIDNFNGFFSKKVYIYSVDGKLKLIKDLENLQTVINLENFRSGIYIVKIPALSFVGKIIVL